MSLDLDLASDWTSAGEDTLDEVIALRRAIHADPEVGLHCPRTTDKALAALAGLPLEIRRSTRTTGFVAILRGSRTGRGSNTRTGAAARRHGRAADGGGDGAPLRQPVPGAMHACGHDAHTAMLVGAAKALCARADTLPGTVVFMFQPGEEGHHGAREMIADGLLADPRPDAAFALHISPNAPAGVFVGRPGPLLASTDTVHAVIRGKGGHAAMPHDAVDPIPAACAVVGALQVMIAREVPVADPAVLTITQIHAGSSHNIIPGEVRMMGTLRTLSERVREQARAGFRRVVEGVAAAHGCTAETQIDEGYPVTMCDPRATALMAEIAGGMGGWETMPAPMMGGEDFSYVLRECRARWRLSASRPKGAITARTRRSTIPA
jgi:hippurate hydrolase